MENEAEKDLQCPAPARLDLPPEKPLSSSVAKQEGQNNGELARARGWHSQGRRWVSSFAVEVYKLFNGIFKFSYFSDT